MKKNKKIIQAFVVVVVVGIGWIHNLDKNSFLYEQFRPVTVSLTGNNEKTDTLQVKENNLYFFSKNIFDSSIQLIISSL